MSGKVAWQIFAKAAGAALEGRSRDEGRRIAANIGSYRNCCARVIEASGAGHPGGPLAEGRAPQRRHGRPRLFASLISASPFSTTACVRFGRYWCPSSNGFGQSELFRDGGSGSFGLEFRRLSTDVAIVAV